MCELCGQTTCVCDRDPENPVEMRQEDWAKVYDRSEDAEHLLEHDHSMDY